MTIGAVEEVIVMITPQSVTNGALAGGDCHVNEVFCDDWCDELIFPQEDLIRRLRVISQ